MNAKFGWMLTVLLLGATLSVFYLNSLLKIITIKRVLNSQEDSFFNFKMLKNVSSSINGVNISALLSRMDTKSQLVWKKTSTVSDTSTQVTINKKINNDKKRTNTDKVHTTKHLKQHLKQSSTGNKSKLVSTVKIKKVKSIAKQKCTDPFLSNVGSQKRFICETVRGGLGNQMFAYASASGIAFQLNRTLVIAHSAPLNRIFHLNAIPVKKCVFKKALETREKKHCSFDGNLLKLRVNRNYRVGPFLQSWKYFKSVIPEVKRQFVFNANITSKAEIIISKIASDKKKTLKKLTNITYVGVHVRRGDIAAKKRFVRYGYQVAPKQYIENAMLYFTSNFTNVVFLICSDNMTWVKTNIKRPDVFYIEGNSAEVDMSVLIKCNHTITTVGTFGWWAGFLAGGITLHYKYPAKEGSIFRKQFSVDYSDHFYPGWIGMK